MSEIRALYLTNAVWGPGGTSFRWVAWYEGEEAEPKLRGYGATRAEAINTLTDQGSRESPLP